jgi:hypothetical protein
MSRNLVLAVAACAMPMWWGCDATGELKGGESLTADPCPHDAGSTWTDLYGCYFGPGGVASCSALGYCHGGARDPGGGGESFVCGPTKDTCWQGITNTFQTCGFDGGPFWDSGAASAAWVVTWLRQVPSAYPPGTLNLLMPCNATFPTTAPGAVPAPQCLPSAGREYTFTPADMARINAWIDAGALNN